MQQLKFRITKTYKKHKTWTVVVFKVGLLRCVRQYFDKLSTADLKPALALFYNEEELVATKDVMIQAVYR